MQNLFIISTNSTPAIYFNVRNGVLNIHGKSLPEDALKFYGSIDNQLDKFISVFPDKTLLITCEFEYINTSSSKVLYSILKKAVDNLEKVVIVWSYEEDDDEMKEQGEIFEDNLGVTFEYRLFHANKASTQI